MVWYLFTWTVISATWLLVGIAIGRRMERLKKPELTKPLCPCGHFFGEHKNGGGCKVQYRRRHYTYGGYRQGYEYVNCHCTQYHGPQPINAAELFNPGVVVQ